VQKQEKRLESAKHHFSAQAIKKKGPTTTKIGKNTCPGGKKTREGARP